MAVAGVLGTVGGDATSFGVGLGPPGTATVFFSLVAILVRRWSSRACLTDPIHYWTLLALIRTGGTGSGDALSDLLGLPASTAATAAVFVVMVLWFYAYERRNELKPR